MDSYVKRQTYRAIESMIRDYIEHDDIWDADNKIIYNTFLNGEIQGMYRMIAILDSYIAASEFDKHCQAYAHEMRKAHTMNLKGVDDD